MMAFLHVQTGKNVAAEDSRKTQECLYCYYYFIFFFSFLSNPSFLWHLPCNYERGFTGNHVENAWFKAFSALAISIHHKYCGFVDLIGASWLIMFSYYSIDCK